MKTNLSKTYLTKVNKIISTVLALLVLLSSNLYSQNNSLYMANVFKKAYEKGTRSYDGLPGKNYWMNRSQYTINASLDPSSGILKGEEKIIYSNNSPDTLKRLVVKTLQDFYKKGSTRVIPISENQLTEGVIVRSLSINGKPWDLSNNRRSFRSGTNLRIFLQPESYVEPGSSIQLNLSWEYKVVPNGLREGVFRDSSYFIGYWYPQMAVYDDYQGWDVTDYTGVTETYNDLADYTVEITMPSNYILWATGDLLNGREIFNESISDKIELSKRSENIIKIIEPEDYRTKIVNADGPVVWKFKAKDVPDFAWAASSDYLWEACAAGINKDNGGTVWVNSLYPPTALQFKNVIGWAKNSMEYFTKEFPGIPYLYDKHYSFNGNFILGMEYPMMANNLDGNNDVAGEFVFEVAAHEIAHGYMPFYSLCNEREFAWMDEGFVTLFGEMALVNSGYKRPEFRFLNTINMYRNLAGTMYDVPLITTTSSINPNFDTQICYAKSATALYYLNEIMEEKGIANPLKRFLEAWEDKHPIPYDFFFYMNTLAGEDLSWYWKPWYFEYASPDLALKEIRQNSDSSEIIVENVGGIPSPLVLQITYADNTQQTIRKSASVWKDTNVIREIIPGNNKIRSVTLGDANIVDINSENNTISQNLD